MCSIDFNKIEKGAFVKESIDILHQAYVSKKLVLFVGAGVDRNSDMSLWDDAKKEFCKHMNIRSEDVDNNIYTTVSQDKDVPYIKNDVAA